jgi:simple sugar transport system ATP-binding protein
MKSYRHAPLANGWSLNYALARKRAQELKDEYSILAPNVETQARLLSGGNLQRAILARELSAKPKLLIAMQPTRGLDVGAIEGVQRLLLAQREAGAAILLSSEELEELLALSDRIIVMYEGEIVGDLALADLHEIGGLVTDIGLMMTGGKRK